MGRRPKQTFFQRRHTDGQETHKRFSIPKSSGKCKSKLPVTSHLSEWLSSKRTQIMNVVKDVDKRELCYIVGVNINWCSHYGK